MSLVLAAVSALALLVLVVGAAIDRIWHDRNIRRIRDDSKKLLIQLRRDGWLHGTARETEETLP